VKCFAVQDQPVPRDRVVMVIDMTEEVPCWEFAAWADRAYLCPDAHVLVGGWCIGSQDVLVEAIKFDDVAETTDSVIEAPTHWSEVPELPAVAGADGVDAVLTTAAG
jgi:hypothetical protein